MPGAFPATPATPCGADRPNGSLPADYLDDYETMDSSSPVQTVVEIEADEDEVDFYV
jgi:hypothetical protein